LHQATGETVNLSIRQDDEIIYVERTAPARAMMRVVQVIGARAPLHITAAGKLFLCEQDAASVKAYAERTKLPAFTTNSLNTLAALSKELVEVKKNGYALDQEEAELGVRCIAAGVMDESGRMAAGLSVSAPAERSKLMWTGLIKDAAAQISKALGYRG
jgi:DNA-binding IclR family transcriptional regulator